MKRLMAFLLLIAALMYAEYRFIMRNLIPYLGEGGTVYIEFIGAVDAYYAEPWVD